MAVPGFSRELKRRTDVSYCVRCGRAAVPRMPAYSCAQRGRDENVAPPELTFVYKGYRVLAFTSPSPYRRYWAWVSFDLFPGMPGAHPRHLVPGEFSDPQAALIAADGYAKGRIDRGEVWG